MEPESQKETRIRNLALSYYSRKDIQEAIFNFSRNRETIPRYFEGFGKRSDSLEYPSDIVQQARKGATSFHCSEEIWQDPLKLSLEMKPEETKELRTGWDLLIDIDSKYLDYSRITAELIIEALKFHGIKNFSIKFSGSKGFHIIIPWKAFPEKIYDKNTKEMFPEYPRIITQYLTDLIKPKLSERIAKLTHESEYVRDFSASKEVMPDLILVSPRHLFRAPYSLHEKTSLASAVITEEELKNFNPKIASPLRIQIRNFYPETKENEARELLISALDWSKIKEKNKPDTEKKFQEIKIDKSKIVYPPCIELIMKGMNDGKKRAVFILINYFRSLGLEFDEIEKKLEDWNKLNKPVLKQGYIQSQLTWFKSQKKMLPPNCDKDYYKGIGICQPDSLCQKIKNPVNYSVVKLRRKK